MPPCRKRRVAQDGADDLERQDGAENDVTVMDRSANRLKVEIPSFDGYLTPEEFIDWLSQTDEILDLKNVPDDRRVPLVVNSLHGRARAWWLQLKESRRSTSKIKRWEEFKKDARAEFLPYNIDILCQGTQSVDEYTTDFYECLEHQLDLNESPVQLVSRYIGGLRHQLQDVLSMFDLSTVAEAHQRASQVEKQFSRSKLIHQHLPSAGATAPPRCIGRCSNKEEISASTPKLIYTVTLCKDEHPECNSRLPALLNALEKMHLTPKFRGSEIIQLQNYKTATLEDVAAVHSALEKTFKESLVAAGAGLSLVDYVVMSAKITNNPPIGFALTCPPGHHAVPDGPMGPCFAGNVAIAARYAQRVHGLKRVLIIDFDAHHGNATNVVFHDDPDVFVLSTYQDGIFPGTGKIEDIGRENCVGATLNLPLPAWSGDIAMLIVYDGVIVPCAQKFKPDIILVSAGYNGHVQDPGSKLQCSTKTYSLLASGIKQLATDLCGGRCVFFLEGGYNLESLSDSVAESFRAFIGEPSNSSELDIHPTFPEPLSRLSQAINKIKYLHNL